MTRRDFAKGLLAATGLPAAIEAGAAQSARTGRAGKPRARQLDPCAIGVISDLHIGAPLSRRVYPGGRICPWQPEAAKKLVAEILALPKPPANVIGLGDIALSFGEAGDYEVAAEVLKPLSDAGIKVTLAMGNHDMRAEFLQSFPGYDRTTKVPGRFVSVVETPHVDFILLDSLVEPVKRGYYGALGGAALGDEQTKWLSDTLASLSKPTFVCAHHDGFCLRIGKLCSSSPKVVGYLHGHLHRWMTSVLVNGYGPDSRTIRMMSFPTFGLDMDVGWGLIRTAPKVARLECKACDFYFPEKLPDEKRPPQWKMFVRDWADRKIYFSLA